MPSIEATSKPPTARREGSPWTGLGAVFGKEFADHLGGARMRVLEWLVLLFGLAAVYSAIQDLRSVAAQDPFLFLRLFTLSRDPLPAFVGLLGFLIPLVAIGLGFDAVNSEFNRRTLSRVLAQPIYRDALLFGKFLASLATIAVSLVALWLLIVGLGLLLLGVPPSGEEVGRGVMFLVVSIAYAGVWLAAAILFSVLFRSAATSALCALGLWLLLSVLWPMLAQFIPQAVLPNDTMILFGVPSVEQLEMQLTLSRLSPNTLYAEAVQALLNPSTRALGLVFPQQLVGAVRGTPLPFGQSLLLVWPQITGLIASAIVLFAITYVAFQRQEVRA
jgi:ABC-2 type transport system permease protein